MHAVPQNPQLALSVIVFVHVLPQSVPFGAVQVHRPPAHCPATHAVPQNPQLALSVIVFVQDPAQSDGRPAGHAHVPALQP